ncbi:hypothetical protein JCM5353_006390 [Sporobolomyces roseus]
MNGLRFIGEIVLRSIFPSNLADSLVGYSDRPSTPHDPYYVSYSSSTVPDLSEVEPFPSLPCELVLRILSFSLPAPGYSTSAQRKRQLLDYALFDQDSSRWASFELRKHIHLESPKSATRFLSALTDRDEEWSGVVRTLRFGQSDPEKSNITASEWMYEDAGSFIAQILNKCPNIDELWIAGAKDLQLKSLSEGTKIRKLDLFETRIVPSLPPTPTPFFLPHLQLLHLKAVICTGTTLDDLLSPSSVPNLDTLDFFSVHQSLVSHNAVRNQQNPANPAQPNLQQLNTMFANLRVSSLHEPPYLASAPQIKHLSLGPYSTRTLPLSSLQLFTSLESLSIPLQLFLQDEVTHLSPSLSAIRLTSAVSKTDRAGRVEKWRELRKNWRDGCEKICRTLSRSNVGLREPVERFEQNQGSGASLFELLYGTEWESVPHVEAEPMEKDWTMCAAVREEEEQGRICIQYLSEWDDEREGARDGLWELGQENWRDRVRRISFA